MKCPKCGTDYDDSFKFCPNCAEANPLVASIQPPQQPPVFQQPTVSSPPKHVSQPPAQAISPEGSFQQPVPPTSEFLISRVISRLSYFGWKKIAIIGVGILAIIGLVVGLTVGLSGGGGKPTESTTTTTETASSQTFTNENWGEVCSDPSGYEGAQVEGLVGKIFTAPDQSGGGIAFQIYADPANSEQNTVVYYFGSDASQFANGDIIKIDGIVGKEFAGESRMGASLNLPTISATTITKTDATALIKGGKEVTVAQQQDQNGVVITVDKMVLRDNETDVFIRVQNNQPDKKATFYAFNAKLQVGNQQLDPDTSKQSQYGDIPSEILPGVEVKGVLVFPAVGTPIPQTGAVALHLEASSENYMADFNPYVFNIGW